MKKIFFCARDIRDYVQAVTDVSKANKVANFPPNYHVWLDSDVVQKYLLKLMRIYEDCDASCDAPVFGETDIEGLRLDFNFGLRLDVPEGNFRVRIGNFDTGEIFLDREFSDVRLISVEKYFVPWHVEIFLDGEKVFEHVFNIENQPVLFRFKSSGAFGDTLAALPIVAEFKRRMRCRLYLLLPEYLREFAAQLYPDLPQVNAPNYYTYATFTLQMYSGNSPFCADFRNDTVASIMDLILGFNCLPAKPKFTPTAPPVTKEPYVCIAVQSSGNRKCWLYPRGWDIVVDALKRLGYRVFCIDQRAEQNNDGMIIRKPEGAEDFTGNRPIMERANMLSHAEFFIGLSSGLSWLADAVNCPVVLVCGFSKDWFEFHTPYRVSNRLVCNGCFNDKRVTYIQRELCPYHKGTPRELECQKKISPRQVMNAVERLIADRNLIPPALA